MHSLAGVSRFLVPTQRQQVLGAYHRRLLVLHSVNRYWVLTAEVAGPTQRQQVLGAYRVRLLVLHKASSGTECLPPTAAGPTQRQQALGAYR